MSNLQELGNTLSKEGQPGADKRFTHLDYLLGKLIFSHRIRNGVTQQQLSVKFDIPLDTIHKVERGQERLSGDTYEEIFRFLLIPEDELEYYKKMRKWK